VPLAAKLGVTAANPTQNQHATDNILVRKRIL
jgi:hypothetical protein